MRMILLSALFCIVAWSARADLEHYQDVGNWKISADFEDGWCLAHATYERSETMVGLIWMPSESGFYILLHNSDWNLPEGTTYQLEMLFEGDQRRHSWTPTVFGTNYLVSSVSDTGVRKLSGRHWVAVYGERGNLVGQFSLEGSRKAMNATIRCTERIEPLRRSNPFGGRPASSNPFGSGSMMNNAYD